MSSIRSRAPASKSAAVRRVMQANRSRDTLPERRIRAELRRAGLRFRTDREPEPGVRCKADIVFAKARVCVFIDGCFWHGCPRHFKCPIANRAWWAEKILDNRLRDRRQRGRLQRRGWRVLRVWEHELRRGRVSGIVSIIVRALRRRTGAGPRQRSLIGRAVARSAA